MLNPGHIDLFRAVIRHGGMTRAAVALGIGQPHVSRAIAHLEGTLGFALFVRGHGSALSTAEGAAFAREVEQTYAGLDHLLQAARRIRETGSGPLRVACQPALVSGLLPRAIGRLHAAYPGVSVAVHCPGPDTIWSWVGADRCDLGLTRPRSGISGVDAETFLTVDAVCAVPRAHPLARRSVIAIRDLAEVPMIAGAEGAFQQRVADAFAEAGVASRFPFVAQYTAARCGLVAQGLGLAVVDPVAAAACRDPAVVLRPLRPGLPIETVLLKPAGRPLSGPVEALVRHLRAERDALAATLTAGRRAR